MTIIPIRPGQQYLSGSITYEAYKSMRKLEELDDETRKAVEEMIRVCKLNGQHAARNFPDLGMEIYAYPHSDKEHISWGCNSLSTGENIERGLIDG